MNARQIAQRMTVVVIAMLVVGIAQSATAQTLWGMRGNPPAPVEFPFIDAFGQYIHDDWPGKIHSLDELLAARDAEEAALAEAPPIPRFDHMGGWLDGPQLEATGWFRTEMVDGKWWLVTPEGRLFISLGITCVANFERTYVEEREDWFEWLPERDDPDFGGFYSYLTTDHSSANAINGEGWAFTFHLTNLVRKYGSSWQADWRNTAYQRMRAWGLNTFGAWTQQDVMDRSTIPFTAIPNSIHGVPVIEASGRMPDFFHPDFPALAEQNIAPTAQRYADNPLCLGFYVDNELPWRDVRAHTLASPPEQPARQFFIQMLQDKYGTLQALNSAWGTNASSWDTLRRRTFLERQASRDDHDAFVYAFAQRYYETVRGVLEEHAPNHLYLGDRYAGPPDEVIMEACAENVDVMSLNLYYQTINPNEWNMERTYGKPAIIGEFHFGALDRGLFHTGLQSAEDQEDRAAKYAAYVRSIASNTVFVGCHWFQYVDSPKTGRWFDGENYNIGFLSVTDTPYPELVAAATAVHGEVYDIRSAHAESDQLYVVPGGSGAQFGTSWYNAFASIQQAVDTAALLGVDVWIAAGTYPITETIEWPDGVAVYGGFPVGGSWEDRNPRVFETVLRAEGFTGSIIRMRVEGSTGNRLDGFTLRDANAFRGALWLGEASWSGGPIAVEATVANCTFIDNIAAQGAAITADDECTLIIENSRFVNNRAQGDSASLGGALLYGHRTSGSITNSAFIRNTSELDSWGGGGAIFLNEPDVEISYCTFYGNAIDAGTGSVITSSPTIRNSIIWDNAPNSVSSNATYINTIHENDRNEDPLFAETDGSLEPNSPAINTGQEPWPSTDVRGVPRPQGAAADIGAFEFIDPVTAPDVVGESEEDARTAIVDAGLAVGLVTDEYVHDVPAGHVASQNPAAGAAVVPGSGVNLVVSLGPPATVPNLVIDGAWLSEAEAQTELEAADLTVGAIEHDWSDTVPEGHVMGQSPEAGADAAPGSGVDLVLSLGSPVTVPGVVIDGEWLSEAEAQAALEAAGLVVGAIDYDWSDTVPEGHVMGQSPVAGSYAQPGSGVDLTLSLGSPVTVPGVVIDGEWLSEAEAQAALEAAGLVVGAIDYDWSDTVPEGHVMGQSPVAGSYAQPGSGVDLIISQGPWSGYIGARIHGQGTLGVDGHLAYADDLGIDGNNPKTVELWVFFEGPWPEDSLNIFYVGNWGGDQGGREFSIRSLEPEWFSPDWYRVQIYHNDFDFNHPIMNRWIHLALVHTGSDTILYADGEEIARRPQGGPVGTGTGQVFAAGMRDRSNANRTMSGYIDDVRVWNVARTPEEIQSHMNDYLTGQEEGLALYWSLNEGEGDTTEDLTSSGFFGMMNDSEWAAIDGAPDLTGLTQEEAETLLVNAGYTVGEVTIEVSDGRVGSQHPPAGHRASPGQIFDFVIMESAQVEVEVPELVIDGDWLTIEDVEAALEAAGLELGTVSQAWSDTVPEGLVMYQSIPAGSSVAPGSAVNITVSRGPSPGMPISRLALWLTVMLIVVAMWGGKTVVRYAK